MVEERRDIASTSYSVRSSISQERRASGMELVLLALSLLEGGACRASVSALMDDGEWLFGGDLGR